MTLSEKRILFTTLFFEWGMLAQQILPFGDSLAFSEGYVALTDAADGDYDGPHKQGGAHYTGLGQDMILYRRKIINGVEKNVPVKDGADPSWLLLGEAWERKHELARWGGRWSDANHFSLEHEGRK